MRPTRPSRRSTAPLATGCGTAPPLAPMPTCCSRWSCLPSLWSAGRDHHLGAVERRDVLVAAGGHRGAQAADQVERAVVLVGGPEQDLLERAVLGGRRRGRRAGATGGRWPCPSGSRARAPRRRAPAASRSSRRRRRRRTPSTMSPPLRMPPSAITFTYSPVSSMCCERAACDVGDRGRLRNADAEHAARGAGGARARRRRARPPRRCASGAGRSSSRRSRRRCTAPAPRAMNSFRLSGSTVRGHVLGRDHRALDDEDVEAGVERDLVVVAHALRRQRAGRDHALRP